MSTFKRHKVSEFDFILSIATDSEQALNLTRYQSVTLHKECAEAIRLIGDLESRCETLAAFVGDVLGTALEDTTGSTQLPDILEMTCCQWGLANKLGAPHYGLATTQFGKDCLAAFARAQAAKDAAVKGDDNAE